MPRPTNAAAAQGGSCKHLESRSSDAARAFETHIQGLVDTFNDLQQQYVDLVLSTRPENHGSILAPQLRAPTGHVLATPHKAVVADEASGSTGPGHVDKHLCEQSVWGLNRTSDSNWNLSETEAVPVDGRQMQNLTSQFHRVDKRKAGKLEEEEIKAVLNSFLEGWELEDRLLLFRYLSDSTAPRFTRAGGVSHEHALTFDGFMKLMTDDRIFEAEVPASVQRDARTLRKAFLKEQDHYLYSDDPYAKDATSVVHTSWIASKTSLFFRDFLPAGVIVLNAAVLGVSTDIEPESVVWQIFECLFLVFYVVEALVKIKFFGVHWYFCGLESRWNVFDFACIVLSLTDVILAALIAAGSFDSPITLESLMIIKMLRMARLARLVRTLRFEVFKELKLMVLGVISGMRCLAWAFVLLFILLYGFGVASSNILSGTEAEFDSVVAAMFTLFRCFTEGCVAYDGRPLTERLRKRYGAAFLAPYFFLYMIIALGVFNLVMAVFLDNVMDSQMVRKLHEISATASHVEIDIKEQLLRVLVHIRDHVVPEDAKNQIKALAETMHSRTARVRAQFSVLELSHVVISRPLFLACLEDREFLAVLHAADIETANADTIFDILDADVSGWLSINELFHGMVRLRGPICKSEIVGIRLRIRHLTQMIHGLAESLEVGVMNATNA
eukprot:TRINITY_DN4282_c0_g1_i3.p1 TRINITY_DN4282_c0_g1~~TRINITY_DN4282_c0_g1_i3.p1  ORF type:complete len:695 (-),score=108.63 TRINITY_DN4282_c0_g1_i3:73-2082(-)